MRTDDARSARRWQTRLAAGYGSHVTQVDVRSSLHRVRPECPSYIRSAEVQVKTFCAKSEAIEETRQALRAGPHLLLRLELAFQIPPFALC